MSSCRGLVLPPFLPLIFDVQVCEMQQILIFLVNFFDPMAQLVILFLQLFDDLSLLQEKSLIGRDDGMNMAGLMWCLQGGSIF